MASPGFPDVFELSAQGVAILAQTPVIAPPVGVTPSFTNPSSNGLPVLVVSSLLLGLTMLFAANRVYMKLRIARKASWDDLTLSIGFLGTIAYYVTCIWGIQGGMFGKHFWDFSVIDIATDNNNFIRSYLVSVLQPPTMLFIKVTFFIMYLDIFRQWRWMKISAIIGGVATAAFYTAMTACFFAFDTPGQGETWASHQISKDYSFDSAFSIPISAVGLGIDLYILILPIIGVSKLQTNIRRKIGAIAIFTSAMLACLGSLLSIVYRKRLQDTLDVTWAVSPVLTATLLELQVGIMVACMPAMSRTCRNLALYLERLKSSLVKSRNYRTSSSQPKSTENEDTILAIIDQYGSSVNRSGHRGRKNFYESMDDSERGSLSLPENSLQTYIHRGSETDVEGEGIHLTFEIRRSVR